MAEYLTKPQFAKRLGISRSAINYAIRQNRIDTISKSGRTLVDWHSQLDRYLRTCKNSDTLRKVKLHLKATHRSKEAEKAGGRYYTPKNSRNTIDPENQSAETLLNKPLQDMTSMDAAELITVVKAKKAQLEYEKEAGKLIEVEVVLPEWLDAAAKVKSAMLSIPDRVSTMLEGIGHVEIHKKLTKEIKHALSNLSQRLKSIEKLKED